MGGQCCCASSRIFVHEDIQEAFIEKVKKLAQGLKTNNMDKAPQDACDLGPQVDEIQFKKILGYIDQGKKEGAKCVLGGTRVGDKGYYIAPTIFADVTDNMVISKEEIFGPVMS